MPDAPIPIMKPQAVKEEHLLPRIRSIAATGLFTNRGPQVRELEFRLAAWLGVDDSRVVVTSNATVALMATISHSPAQSWHIPAWSFPATALAPLLLGKDITFVDIRAQDWLVSDERVQDSTGLMNVIPFGGSFDSTAWSYPGEIIIDAAASLASRPIGLKDLPASTAVIFSLHATKTMGGAEGGLAVFGSEQRAQQARSWINFGFSGSRESLVVGSNGKMSEYDAAVANARLDGWGEEEKAWRDIRQAVNQTSETLHLEKTPDSMRSVNPYWIALFNTGLNRQAAWQALEAAQVETRLWWAKGLHEMPAFNSVLCSNLRVVENLSERYLGLPFHLSLSQVQINRIVEVLKPFGLSEPV